MLISRFCAVLIASSAAFCSTSLPTFAASPVTQAFLADVNPTIDFLDRSSRLALDNSKTTKLRDFAKTQAREQTLAANTLDRWIDSESSPPATVVTGTDGVMTGRSVALDRPAPTAFPPVNQEDFDRMYGETGSDFDRSYKSAQLDSLTRLVSAYQEYITNGDEPALKALATSELPKISRRVTELSKL